MANRPETQEPAFIESADHRGDKMMCPPELLDDFFEEYEDKMASDHYMAAKDDPDYFSVLIKLACHDQVPRDVDKGIEQLLPYFNWKTFTQI